MKTSLVLIPLLVAAGMPTFGEQTGVTLIRDGHAESVVVIPPFEQSITGLLYRQCVSVLRSHLKQMAGIELPTAFVEELGNTEVKNGRLVSEVVKFQGRSFVLIGESHLTKSLGISSDGLKAGGMIVKTSGNVVALIGHPRMSHSLSDGGGIRAAVVALLRQLGCRYIWPGPTGKIIPKRTTVEVRALDVTYNPVIPQRHIRFLSMNTDRPLTGLRGLRMSYKEWADGRAAMVPTGDPWDDFSWGAWHGLGGDIGIQGGHAFGEAWETWGERHPGWFALQPEGSRDQSDAGDRERLCVSNAELIRAIADDILTRARADTTQLCFSACPNDGGRSNFCLCDQCKALDPPNAPEIDLAIFYKDPKRKSERIKYRSLTDRYIYFWNRIAEHVAKERPEILIVGSAYSYYSLPPVQQKLHPNVVVRYVPADDKEREGWLKAGATKIFWRPNILLRGRRTVRLLNYGRELTDSFHSLNADGGILATDFDSIIGSWALHGLNYFAAARLNWNPSLEWETILTDYCKSGFGPAAETIRKYFDLAETITMDPEKTYTAPVIAKLRTHLNRAAKITEDISINRRIDLLRLGLNLMEIQVTVDEMAKAAAGQKVDLKRARQLMDLNYIVMRDVIKHHNLAVNVAYVSWGSGNFAKWRPLGWAGKPSPAILETIVGGPDVVAPGNVARPKALLGRLTGKENTFEEMMGSLRVRPAEGGGGLTPMPSPKIESKGEELDFESLD